MKNSRGQFFEQDKIKDVLDRINIVDLVSNYVSLKKAGVNHKGLCPFHSEKTPSFVVSEPKQMFHCFGCGAGGNAIKFYMDIERKSFPEAIKELAEKNGITLEQFEISPEEEKRKKQQTRYFTINKLVAGYFEHNLWNSPQGKKVLEYLYKRKISNETIKAFSLGYSSDDWQELKQFLHKKNVSEKEMKDLGLISQNQDGSRTFDKFRGRLMFPIMNQNGQIVAFGGRIIDKGEPKYLNSPDTVIYNKGKHLYGLNQARHEIRIKDSSIVVEGYMDVLVCHQFGFTNTVASLGTALTESQAKLLMRYSINSTIAYDGDDAGRAAAIRAMEVMNSAGLKTSSVQFPSGLDPDDYLLKNGRESFESMIKQAENPVLFKLDFLLNDATPEITGKNKLIEDIARDIFLITSTMIRDDIIKKVSARLGLQEDAVRSELRLLYQNKKNRNTNDFVIPEKTKKIKDYKINKDQGFVLQKISEDRLLIHEVEKRGGSSLFDKELQTIYFSFANQENNDIIENRNELDEQLVSCIMLQECVFTNEGKAFKEILNKLYAEKLEKDFQDKQYQLGIAEKQNDVKQMMDVLKEIETIIKNKDRIRRGLFN